LKKRQLYAAAGRLGGVLLSLLISGENDYVPAILGGIFGVGTVLLLRLYKKPEQNTVPERDERMDTMISRFSNYLSIIAIGVLWLAVFVFDYLGYQSIDLDLINGFLLLVLFTFLIGLTILKKK
jgi:hypothetical protein